MIDLKKLIEEIRKKEFRFVSTKAKNKFFKSVLPTVQISHSLDNVFIFCSPRSGSTWILELLLKTAKYRAVFEPIPSLEKALEKYGTPRLILSEDAEDHEFEHYFNGLLKPNFLNKKKWRYTDLNSRNIHLFTKGIAIKTTRGNFCVDFIEKNTEQNMRIVFLVRNPFAVIKSRITRSTAHNGRLKNKFSYNLKGLFASDDVFFKDYFGKYEPLLVKVKDDITEHAFMWCIENKHILDRIGEKSRLMLAYENLYTDFDFEYKKLCDYIGIPVRRNIQKHKNIKSTTSFSGKEADFIESSVFDDSQIFLRDWKDFFTEKNIADVMEILGDFEIDYKKLLKERSRSLVDLPG